VIFRVGGVIPARFSFHARPRSQRQPFPEYATESPRAFLRLGRCAYPFGRAGVKKPPSAGCGCRVHSQPTVITMEPESAPAFQTGTGHQPHPKRIQPCQYSSESFCSDRPFSFWF